MPSLHSFLHPGGDGRKDSERQAWVKRKSKKDRQSYMPVGFGGPVMQDPMAQMFGPQGVNPHTPGGSDIHPQVMQATMQMQGGVMPPGMQGFPSQNSPFGSIMPQMYPGVQRATGRAGGMPGVVCNPLKNALTARMASQGMMPGVGMNPAMGMPGIPGGSGVPGGGMISRRMLSGSPRGGGIMGGMGPGGMQNPMMSGGPGMPSAMGQPGMPGSGGHGHMQGGEEEDD